MVSTSEGRYAVSDGMFSASAPYAVTLIFETELGDRVGGGQHRGRAGHVALHRVHAVGRLEVQAAGVERDALADQGQVGLGAARPVAQPDQPRRPGRAAADGQQAAVAALGQRLLVQHLDADPGALDQRRGLLGEGGGVEQVGRDVDPLAGRSARPGRRPSASADDRRWTGRAAACTHGDRVDRRRCGSGTELTGRVAVAAEQRALGHRLRLLRLGRRPATRRPRVAPSSASPAAWRTPAPAARRRSSGVGSSAPSPTTTIRGPSPAAGSVRVCRPSALAPSATAISATEVAERLANAALGRLRHPAQPGVGQADDQHVGLRGQLAGDGQGGQRRGRHVGSPSRSVGLQIGGLGRASTG